METELKKIALQIFITCCKNWDTNSITKEKLLTHCVDFFWTKCRYLEISIFCIKILDCCPVLCDDQKITNENKQTVLNYLTDQLKLLS